jgi:hypothetical protein
MMVGRFAVVGASLAEKQEIANEERLAVCVKERVRDPTRAPITTTRPTVCNDFYLAYMMFFRYARLNQFEYWEGILTRYGEDRAWQLKSIC